MVIFKSQVFSLCLLKLSFFKGLDACSTRILGILDIALTSLTNGQLDISPKTNPFMERPVVLRNFNNVVEERLAKKGIKVIFVYKRGFK